MKKILITTILLCCVSVIHSQIVINEPIPYKDSLNINKITVYQVDNFICTDTTITIIELDSLARIRRKSTYVNDKLIKDYEHFLDNKSNYYIKSVLIQDEDLKLKIPAKQFIEYEYDLNNNIIGLTARTIADTIIQETKYYYNTDSTINKIEYEKVPFRFQRSKPNGTIDTFSYNLKDNLIETIRVKPNGYRRTIKKSEISQKRFDLSNIKDNKVEFIEEKENRKTRTLFWFDDRLNIIRKEGFMSLKDKEGKFAKESKIFTTINKIEYRK